MESNIMQSPEQISNILMVVLVIMIIILAILSFIYLAIRMNESKKKKRKEKEITRVTTATAGREKTVNRNAKIYTKQPIDTFMEFDAIEDNMIIQKDGKRFLMVVQCQGVNYDLMSGMEKTAVEEGFIEFLNTLRHPIQIYVQTKTVNLGKSIQAYKDRMKIVQDNLANMRIRYNNMIGSGKYPKSEIDKTFYEITKLTNLYEYGRDIIKNTEKMSLNKNVLKKEYYIIIPYFIQDSGTINYDKEEQKSMAFSELYTRSQSIIRTLSACSVTGKILNSSELVDLLYVAYNRDESETYGVEKAKKAGYDELYSTAPDVFDKKMKELDKEIEKKAIELANQKIDEVKSERQKRFERKQSSMDDLIKDMAKLILEENKDYVGPEVAEDAIDKIDEEGGRKSEKEQKNKAGRSKAGN